MSFYLDRLKNCYDKKNNGYEKVVVTLILVMTELVNNYLMSLN